MAEPITHHAYAVLGVEPDSEDLTVVAAYRAMARRFHPDRAGDAATARMMQVNAAFDRLRTPERRAAYDLELERSGLSLPRRAHRGSASAPNTRIAPEPAGPTPMPVRRAERDGTGGAGRPPGRASGSVLPFGRHIGWSIGEIVRVDPGYLVRLEDRREGGPYREEIDRALRAAGHRAELPTEAPMRGRRRRS